MPSATGSLEYSVAELSLQDRVAYARTTFPHRKNLATVTEKGGSDVSCRNMSARPGRCFGAAVPGGCQPNRLGFHQSVRACDLWQRLRTVDLANQYRRYLRWHPEFA